MLILVEKGMEINKFRFTEVIDLDYFKDLNISELRNESVRLEKESKDRNIIAKIDKNISKDRLRWAIMASDVVVGFNNKEEK